MFFHFFKRVFDQKSAVPFHWETRQWSLYLDWHGVTIFIKTVIFQSSFSKQLLNLQKHGGGSWLVNDVIISYIIEWKSPYS